MPDLLPVVDPDGASHLRADCSRCVGLCCVALPFARSSDFAFSKDAGDPCRNLDDAYGCRIHTELRPRGMPGCTVFDCFGAGQQVTQVVFGGRTWRGDPQTRSAMFAVFPVVRMLHELLWYLTCAAGHPAAASLRPGLLAMRQTTEALAAQTPDGLLALDVEAHRLAVNELLLGASALVRATAPGRPVDRRGADLVGARLRGADLRGANLRGAYLIGADLRGSDLRAADVIGVDLRDADVRGADLTGALFLTQAQVNAARGDATTRLDPTLDRPSHWG